jgi:hypothetical protein
VSAVRIVLVAAVLLTFGAAPAAHAALPKFKDKTIVVGKSIGGVKLGAPAAAAKKSWGATGGLCDAFSCLYRVKGDTNGTSGEGTIAFQDKTKVTRVSLKSAVAARGGHTFKPPFTTPVTSKGIGLGATAAKVKKAYPKTQESGNYLTLSGAGGIQTTFTYDTATKRVFEIVIELIPSDS